MSSRLTRVLEWRWTPWLFNIAAVLALRALLPVDLSNRGERYTYYGMSRGFPLPECATFHCFRVLPPLFTALVPGQIADAFIVTNAVFQALAGVTLWHLAWCVSRSRRVAWLTTAWYWVTWAPIMSLGDPLLITDPVQAFWCFSSLYLLFTEQHGLAFAMLVSGAAVKESVLLVPVTYAGYVALTAPRAAWRPIRLGVLIAAPIAAWIGLRAALHAHGYSTAGDSSYLRQTYFFGVWLVGLAAWPVNVVYACLYMFAAFGAGWILAALGFARAKREERALAVAALPAMLFLALYQVPDRALATFPYAVLILAARVVSQWPAPLTALLLAVNAAFTIRMNFAPRWLPSSSTLLAALVLLVAFGAWTDRRSAAAASSSKDDARPQRSGEVAGLATTVLAVAIGLVAVFVWRASRVPPVVDLAVTAVAVVEDDAATPALALSPDERAVVFVGRDASGARRLWRQDVDSAIAAPLAGTTNASAPFWAPDGDRVGFFADGHLKTLDLRSAAVRIVADAPAPRGGAWGAGDVIVFAPSERQPLFRVPAIGGTPASITTLDGAAGQVSHRWPSFLPDGEHFLFNAWESQGAVHRVYLGSLTSRAVRREGSDGDHPVFAGGFLLLIEGASDLFAEPFDLRRLEALGQERLVHRPVAYSREFGRGAFTAGTHTLVYARMISRAEFRAAPVVAHWRDRVGRVTLHTGEPRVGITSPLIAAPPGGDEPEVSPDGRWVAYTIEVAHVPQVLVRPNAVGGAATQVTLEGGMHPHWRGDGREFFLLSGNRDVAAVTVDAATEFHSSAPRPLFAVDFPPGDATREASNFVVSPDGEHIFVREIPGQRPSAPLSVVRDWRSRLGTP